LNILHIYKDYFPVRGGIENHVRLLAEAQAARGHRVSVLATSRDARTHVAMLNGVRVIFAARLVTLLSTPISLALFRYVRGETPDVTHLHFPYPLGEIAQFLCGRARAQVLTYHSDIIRQKITRALYRPWLERVLARTDRIIATSPNYVATSPILTRWQHKCVIVPLGIDPAPFERASVQHTLDAMTRVLFVGKLRYYKGVDVLLEALRELPRVHLTIVGSGPMERAWRARVHQLNLAERVQFVGQVENEDLPRYYAACDIFVLPSSERSEAFGVVQLEAMAAGKPVICTELGTGTSFVNVHGETGLVVPPRAPRALASAIAQLSSDATLRARLGAAGRARVRAEFTLDKMVTRILQVYEQVLQAGK